MLTPITQIISLGILLLLNGCGIIPAYTSMNHPRVMTEEAEKRDIKPVPRASMGVTSTCFPACPFLGITLSGGGSRAANFSAAVLQELNQYGFLKYATMIYCVSGGCLTGGYFGLHGFQTNWEELKENLKTDFLLRWIIRNMYPQNLILSGLTDYDRSDVMAEVFDDILFHGATFSDLSPDGPNLIMTSTDFSGERFIFSEEYFESIGSRIDNYPLSYAVMASSAFPFLFNSVTLTDFGERGASWENGSSPKGYVHLFDGGPTGNLGIRIFEEFFDKAVATAKSSENISEEKIRNAGCLVIMVDASPPIIDTEYYKRDTREGLSYLVDKNGLLAGDTLLRKAREEKLEQIRTGPLPLWEYPIEVHIGEGESIIVPCHIWHITFDRLGDIPYFGSNENEVKNIHELVSNIKTNFNLSADPYDVEELQEALYKAAHILVRDDTEIIERVCDWFTEKKLNTWGCESY